MRFLLLMFVFLLLQPLTAHAQFDGLWLIKEVTAGSKVVTPVSRWTRFHQDGNTQSGNGWVQHTVGKWQYNPADSSLSISNDNGWKDEAGAFKVIHKTSNSIRMQRLEEGKLITVSMEKAETLPQTLTDKVLGLWLLTPTGPNNKVASTQQPYALMRWDRRFNFKGIPGGLDKGFWQIDGHQPILTLISGGTEQQWRVEVQPTSMTWTKIAPVGQEQVLHFTRTDSFPE